MLLRHRLLRMFAAVALGLGLALAMAWPLRAADTIGLEFGPFLRSAYVGAVSAEPFRLHLVRDLPPAVLERLEPGVLSLE